MSAWKCRRCGADLRDARRLLGEYVRELNERAHYKADVLKLIEAASTLRSLASTARAGMAVSALVEEAVENVAAALDPIDGPPCFILEEED